MSVREINPDPGQEREIEMLVALLRDSENEFTRRQAAESLGKIGTGNSIAIEALIELLLDTAKDAQTRIHLSSTKVKKLKAVTVQGGNEIW